MIKEYFKSKEPSRGIVAYGAVIQRAILSGEQHQMAHQALKSHLTST